MEGYGLFKHGERYEGHFPNSGVFEARPDPVTKEMIARGINPYDEMEAGEGYIPEGIDAIDEMRAEMAEISRRALEAGARRGVEPLAVEPKQEVVPRPFGFERHGKRNFKLESFGKSISGMKVEGPYGLDEIVAMRRIIERCGYSHLTGLNGERILTRNAGPDRIAKVWEHKVKQLKRYRER